MSAVGTVMQDVRRAPMPVATEARRLADTSVASFAPASYDATAGEVEVTWSTGAAVRRYDWWSDQPYDEELDLAGAALGRLNVGAPLLLDHANAVAAVVGSVAPGSALVDAAGGRARLRFDRTSEAGRAAEAKVAAGHVRHVSVGYVVRAWEKIEADGQVKRWIARDWEPYEISLVGAPADPGAAFRGAPGAGSPPPHNPTWAAPVPPLPPEVRMTVSAPPSSTQAPPSATSEAAIRAERARTQEIHRRCRALGLPEAFADEMVEGGLSVDAAATRIVDKLSERTIAGPRGPRWDTSAYDHDGPEAVRSAMSEALAARMMNREPAGPGERYRGWPMHEMARRVIEHRGTSTQGWGPAQVMDEALSRGMHTTSDFPLILGGAVNRSLAEAYRKAQSPIRQALCRVRQADDFRELSTARVSDFPALEKVGEGGEVKFGTLAEDGETYKVDTYAKGLNLSRQALVNDDLGAFAQATRSAASASAETEARILVGLLTKDAGAGPVLRDGARLFAVARGTLAAAGTGIAVASVSAGRAAMRRQKDVGNGGPLGVGPKFLLVSPEMETDADQLVAVVQNAELDKGNPFGGKLVPLVEPRLEGKSWFLFADPEEAAVFEIAYLNGRTAPQVQSFEEANTLGVKLRAVFDVGAGVIGWRGAYRNAGAA